MKRWILRGLIVALVGLAGLGFALWRAWSPRAPTYRSDGLASIELQFRQRTPEEHDATRARFGSPYVLELEAPPGALVYYGASHFRSPNDPQASDIESRWDAFRPTVALCEGRRRGYLIGRWLERWTGRPEPAIVHALARRDGVALYSLEPDYETEVADLLVDWSAEQVALYFTMRVYWSEAGGQPDDDLAEHLLAKRTAVAGLEGALGSAADIDRVWQRDFPELADWRGLRGMPADSYLREIDLASRRVRGRHMMRTLIDLVRQGERVFAVVGSGHVIRQEWALRAALGAPPAWDQ